MCGGTFPKSLACTVLQDCSAVSSSLLSIASRASCKPRIMGTSVDVSDVRRDEATDVAEEPPKDLVDASLRTAIESIESF